MADRGSSPDARRCYAVRHPMRVVSVSLLVLAGCAPVGNKSPHYAVSAVTRGEIIQHVTASGTLSAVVSVDVGSQVSGRISAMYADFNSPVKKGQVVAEIDPTIYRAALRQAEGELASAKADAMLKSQSLQRKSVLVPKQLASQADLDQATAELAQARAAVTIKQAALESAQANLGYCRITAPLDGVVIARKVSLGQTLASAMNTPVLFTIAQDIVRMNIAADVSESDIGQVKEGQSVTFTTDAFPTTVFDGTVVQVRRSATTTQNVVTYQAIISVENREQNLFPGMTAEVSILVSRQKDVLTIPNAALRYAPPDDATYEGGLPHNLRSDQRLVYAIAAQGQLRPIVVQTGITDGASTEVLAGLHEGMEVVTSSLSNAPNGGGLLSPPPLAQGAGQ